MKLSNLDEFIKENCGSVANFATHFNITPRAVYKWTEKNSLPRTEFTGETSYSEYLAKLSGIPANQIKENFKPNNKQLETA